MTPDFPTEPANQTEGGGGANLEPGQVKAALRDEARSLGFDAFGVAELPVELRGDYFRRWIAEGQHGTMTWLARDPDHRLNARHRLPEAQSVVVVGLNYYQPDNPRHGYRLAKYALGKDYHGFILKRLQRLCRWLRETVGSAQRPYVDTGPLLEKPLAEAAGLGWQGKSTILIHRPLGTWLFLGTILTTAKLPPDLAPGARPKDHCGGCTRCLDACPTRAITAPYQLDARRCLSYLTIEHDGPFPLEFRRALGSRAFGCDECLDVCPWNRWAQVTSEARLSPVPYPDIATMLRWSPEDFAAATSGTALKRTGLRRWHRNLLVVLGNIGALNDLPLLEPFLAASPGASTATESEVAEDYLPEHARWAAAEIRQRHGGKVAP